MHSHHSRDAMDPIAKMAEAGYKVGLKYICLTEHVDYHPNNYSYRYFNYESYTKELDKARTAFQDKIHILKGIEFSDPQTCPKEYEIELARDYDMIMCSTHMVYDYFVGESYMMQGHSVEEIVNKYYEQLLETVEAGRFNVVGHFDLPRRYYGYTPIKPSLLEKILTEMIREDIVLEINTNGTSQSGSDLLPREDVLSKYYELGGRRLTVGSDSHSYRTITRNFDKVNDKRFEYGVFVKRQFLRLS